MTAGLTTYPELSQGTPEWHAARCGLLTASVIGRLLTPTGKIADNETSRGLGMALIAERITGRVDDIPMTASMWRGQEEEPLARDMYSEHHAPVDELGFMVRQFDGCRIGYSPDGLVGDDGLIEIKSRSQKAQVSTIMSGQVPAANMAQLQCGLLVSGRQWIDYVSYSSGMPLWVKRIHPYPDYQATLLAAARQFEDDAANILDRYRAKVAGLPVADLTPDWTEMSI